MRKEKITYALMSSNMNIEISLVKTERIQKAEWLSLKQSFKSLSQSPFFITNKIKLNFDEMINKCKGINAF